MLIYVGPRRQTARFRDLPKSLGLPPIRLWTYGHLYRARRLPAATYIFLGIDRLDAAERRLAGQFYRHVNSLGDGWRALNDPARAMGRYRLLRTLYEQGINGFNAWLAAETTRPERFPVFVRSAMQSLPPLTGLLPDQAALDAELDRLIAAGEPPEDLLIIEYCGEEWRPGLFRKLAMFRAADRFCPRTVLGETHWYVKFNPKVALNEDEIAFDTAFMRDMPWLDDVRRVFEIANIEYGRVDFSLVGGRPQFYEVNFNPHIFSRIGGKVSDHPQRQANSDLGDRLAFEAVRSLDLGGRGNAPTLTTHELTAYRLRFWRNYAPQRY